MNYVKYLLIVGCTLLLLQVNAQKQRISGYVYDSQTHQPLDRVGIKTTTDVQITQSDKRGYFEIPGNFANNQIKVTMIGYKTQIVDLDADIAHLNIQLDVNTIDLNEVRVTGYNENKTRKETAGSVALITSREINRGSAVSLQSALNSIPGVRMDQSTLSEARISIRGNGVRASYGIRNIKIYVNEIPVTEADGTTRIEALDVNSIGRAEVIKGPASSIYGAGTGGVVNFQLQRSPYQERSIETAGLMGGDGLYRLATTFRNGGDQVNSYVSYGWQEYKGYRKHSQDMRRFLTGNFQLFPSDKRIITLLLNRTTQHAQIPGSLTLDQMKGNPIQANAGNIDKKAGRLQTWTRIGMAQQYLFNENFSNSTSVFTYFYDLNHPLPFAYLRNFYQSYGGRTRFSFDPGFERFPTTFTVGLEFNEGLTKGSQYVNNHGKEGQMNSNIDYKNQSYSLFYQSETLLGQKTSLILGLGYNGLNYHIHDYLYSDRDGDKRFKPQATPRVALSHNFGEALSLHASLSSGFSPPASSEIKNIDGSINPSIEAEKALNYEINAKGNLLKSRLAYDLSLFKMDMKGELIAQAIQQGITIYHNAGRTSHKGAELALSYQLSRGQDNFRLQPFISLTYSDFDFKEYSVLNADNEVTAAYDGNELTGIAPWVISAGIDLETKTGLYFYGSYFYSDRLPLNDENSVYNSSYHVLDSRIGYKIKISAPFLVNIYGGVDNIFNRKYSSIVSLNAADYGGGAAYYNPSPGRNAYGGISFKYLF